jgi:hypothetical protein
MTENNKDSNKKILIKQLSRYGNHTKMLTYFLKILKAYMNVMVILSVTFLA